MEFRNFYDKIKYGLRDWTSAGTTYSPMSFISDEQVYKFSPERYGFYMQLLDSLRDVSNPSKDASDPNNVINKVFSIENKTRIQREKLDSNIGNMVRAMKYLYLRYKPKKEYVLGGGSRGGDGNDLLARVDALDHMSSNVETLAQIRSTIDTNDQDNSNSLGTTILSSDATKMQPDLDDLSTRVGVIQNMAEVVPQVVKTREEVDVMETSELEDRLNATSVLAKTIPEVVDMRQKLDKLEPVVVSDEAQNMALENNTGVIDYNDYLQRTEAMANLASFVPKLADIRVKLIDAYKKVEVARNINHDFQAMARDTIDKVFESNKILELAKYKLQNRERIADLHTVETILRGIDPNLMIMPPRLNNNNTGGATSLNDNNNETDIKRKLERLQQIVKERMVKAKTKWDSTSKELEQTKLVQDELDVVRKSQAYDDSKYDEAFKELEDNVKYLYKSAQITKKREDAVNSDYKKQVEAAMDDVTNRLQLAIDQGFEITNTTPKKDGGGLYNMLFSGGAEAEPSFYTTKLKELRAAENAGDRDTMRNVVDEVSSHPVYSEQFEKISMTDRAIFIAFTYAIRGICIFLIDWGINSFFITSFNKAFFIYSLCYLSIFMVWVMLANAGGAGENAFFKLLFYYINYDAHGLGRIMAHLLVQLFLFPIPFLVKEKVQGEEGEELTYERKRYIYRVLSKFSFFIWVLTSVIALKY